MNILLIEPYFTGSHKQWAVGFANHSRYDIRFLTMKGQFWKWRMHGGAVSMARELEGELDDTVSCARNYLEEFLLALFEAVVETPGVALVFSASSESFAFNHERLVKFRLDSPLTFVPNETQRRAIYQIASDRNLPSPREAIEWIFDRGLNYIQKGAG